MGGTSMGWTNPIVGLATLIIISLIVLIGAAVLGIDQGFLQGMAKPEYARGVITYLFALITIGVAMGVVLQALAGSPPVDDVRLQRGKDVLALLLGVFGTMVGFYFASEKGKPAQELHISSLDLTPQPVASTGALTVRAVIIGGAPPYKFGLGQDGEPPLNDVAGQGGWITKQLQLNVGKQGESPSVRLIVEDVNRKRAEQAAPVKIAPQ